MISRLAGLGRPLGRVLRKDADLREVVRLAGFGLVLRGSGAAISLGIGILVGRLLGADGAGLYFFAVSVVNVGSSFGRVGFGAVIVRNIAESVARRKWARGRFVYGAGMKLVGAISAIVALAVLASAPWASRAVFSKPEYEIPLVLAALAIVPFALSWTEGDALRALRRIPSAQLAKAVLPYLVTLILLYPMIRLWGAEGAIGAFLVGAVATALIGHRLWRRAWRRVPGNTGSSGPVDLTVRTLMASSWALVGVALANMGVQNAASIILGAMGSNADVGVFNLANRVSAMLLLPLFGVIGILAPKFVHLNTVGDMAGLQRLVRRSFWLLFAVVIPAAALLFAIAGPVMSMFGPHFERGVPVLRILLISAVVNTGTGPTGQVLLMCGHERAVWKLSLTTLVLSIGGCVAGQRYFGVIGLTWALVASLVVQNFVLVFLVRRHLGFWPLGFLPPRKLPTAPPGS